jgi:glycosyltransferase involved in cell wall biosynthesis
MLDRGTYDAFVYPAAVGGTPDLVLEAMAAGTPVIAPDVGGIRKIIVDGVSGLLFPARANEDEMAAAMQRQLSDTRRTGLCAKNSQSVR